MKYAFDGLISILDTAQEGNAELEDISIEIFKVKNREKKRLKYKNKNTIVTNVCGTATDDVAYIYNGNTEQRRKRTEQKKYLKQ